jgi:hypothetical protein
VLRGDEGELDCLALLVAGVGGEQPSGSTLDDATGHASAEAEGQPLPDRVSISSGRQRSSLA